MAGFSGIEWYLGGGYEKPMKWGLAKLIIHREIFLGYDDQMMKFTMHLDLDGMMLVLTRSQMGACRGPVVVLFDLATILFFGTKSSTLQPGCK